MRRAVGSVGGKSDVLAELLMLIGQRLGKPPGYERMVRMILPPEKCRTTPARLITLRGEPLFLADPRTALGWHILFFGTYEPELRAFLLSFLKPGYVGLDVGANVGWHTLLMAMKVGREGQILAVEPNPSVRQVLVNHIKLNRLSQVRVLPYALTDHDGTMEFVGPLAEDSGSGDGFIVTDPGKVGGSVIHVEARSFDTLLPTLDLQRLDFVKMDIEGFEYRALLGMRTAMARFRPVIALEFNAAYVHRCGASRDDIGKLLDEYSYQTFLIHRTGMVQCSYSSWPECCDLVAVPNPSY